MAAASAPAPEIFRAYDIRGVVGDTLTGRAVEQIGRAFAAEALAVGQQRVVVGGDGRATTDALRAQLLRGLLQSGVDVVDVGMVPTPLLYYGALSRGARGACPSLERGARGACPSPEKTAQICKAGTGVMITGSHNPPEYNGLKMMIAGAPLTEEGIQALRRRIEANDFRSGNGKLRHVSILERYQDRVLADVAVARPLKVVADCGNGVAGLVAPRLLAALGCDVTPLYAEVDGAFPNHHPDPAEAENLADLIAAVRAQGADVGVAFDGDGDRLGVVTDAGEIIWPDRVMMLFARDILRRRPGAGVVFDVKCSRHLPALVRCWGGEPMMCRTGHSHIKAKIRASGAAFGGEFSGHLCFADRWFGFDDGIYSAARLAEILAADVRPASAVFAEFPKAIATPEIKLRTTEQGKFAIVEKLRASPLLCAGGADAKVTTIDGLRVDFADGWGLARASNTSPVLSLRFEADDGQALARIRGAFDSALRAIDPQLALGAGAP